MYFALWSCYEVVHFLRGLPFLRLISDCMVAYIVKINTKSDTLTFNLSNSSLVQQWNIDSGIYVCIYVFCMWTFLLVYVEDCFWQFPLFTGCGKGIADVMCSVNMLWWGLTQTSGTQKKNESEIKSFASPSCPPGFNWHVVGMVRAWHSWQSPCTHAFKIQNIKTLYT